MEGRLLHIRLHQKEYSAVRQPVEHTPWHHLLPDKPTADKKSAVR